MNFVYVIVTNDVIVIWDSRHHNLLIVFEEIEHLTIKAICVQGHLLLTWINFNSNMDK